ncbi:diguanylate cyclase [Deinococcus sp. AJ005]|uniref:diguanylate cyclase n=1 Tax=Deinococcus sp. AJ005 TaxID=2652443 RepID=UPI001865884E|nr:diguanylate cyclase [Deinococcus sp. AJ005]
MSVTLGSIEGEANALLNIGATYISLGAAVSQLNPDTLAVQDVMQSADDALYAAKYAGRNRVEIRQVKASAG